MSIVPCVTNANPSLSLLGGGGGGGSVGPVINASTINVSSIIGNDGGFVTLGGQAIAFSPSLGCFYPADGQLVFQDNKGALVGVSSINGQPPAGGSTPFSSTFTVSCPANTSTVLMAMPAGSYSYNGFSVFPGNTEYLNGFVNAAQSITTGYYYGSILPLTDTQPAVTSTSVMTLNFGDSALSTIKLIVANNSAQTASFAGGVFKLF